MKAIICLMCVAAVAALPKALLPSVRRGDFVLAYDNSLENGYVDRSLEWVYRPQGASTRTGSTATFRSRPQKVADLRSMLNSGFMDRSDEMMLRYVMDNPKQFANRPYFVDASGEVNFYPPGFGGQQTQGGAQASGVQTVKK